MLLHYLRSGLQTRAPPGAAFDYYSHDSDRDLHISKDLLMMFFLSSLCRVYWSISPDPVYHGESVFLQVMALLDLLCTPVVWGLCVVCSNTWVWTAVVAKMRSSSRLAGSEISSLLGSTGASSDKFLRTGNRSDDIDGEDVGESRHMKMVAWSRLTGIAFIVSVVLRFVLPDIQEFSNHGYPMVELALILNLILDGFAILPQIMLVAKRSHLTTESHANAQKASNFLGLQCVSRVLRMLFWTMMYLQEGPSGENVTTSLWTMIIPDAVHSLIMADYMWIWINRVRVETIEPWMRQAALL